jgi:Flp pilus assembly protein TadG
MTRLPGRWPTRIGRRIAARLRGRRGDRGSVAVLMCYIVLLGTSLATFLVDAGTNIQAANKADTYSAEAARAASIAVGPIPSSDGTSTLRAADAARAYLTQAGVTNQQVTVVGPATVRVSVTVTESTPILGLSVSQTRTHTAQLQIGVTSGQGAG